jgi:hypothetical protein
MIKVWRALAAVGLLLGLISAGTVANAQEVRYSWFEFGFSGQDVGRTGTGFDPINPQTVDISGTDGTGVTFKGSVGSWRNFYAFFHFTSTNPTSIAIVTGPDGPSQPVEDEFDLTTIRGGIGYKYALTFKTDIVGEVSYDSVDYDFGRPIPNVDFDIAEKDFGGLVGIRSMFNDDLELRAHARYTNVGDVDLTAKTFDSDVLFGVGLGFTLFRGLSVSVDYESGELSTWSVGFRLDLDED